MNARRAFTLIELLIVVVLLGIAGMLVVPAMGSVGVLRIQAAVRTLVSDLTFAQGDAIAQQQRRAVVFDVPNNRYTLVQVVGGQINTDTGALYNPGNNGNRFEISFDDPQFAGATMASANFGSSTAPSTLIFDDMGSPAAAATGDTAGTGGAVRITGQGQTFDIIVEPFTGRVSVRRINAVPTTPTPVPTPEPIN